MLFACTIPDFIHGQIPFEAGHFQFRISEAVSPVIIEQLKSLIELGANTQDFIQPQ